MRRLNIRWKLTLWYGLVLAGVLAAFGVATYWTTRQELLERIDQGLDEELSDVLSEIRRGRNESALREWLGRRFAQHEGFDFQITRSGGERFFYSKRLAGLTLPLPDSGVGNVPGYRILHLDPVHRWRVVCIVVAGPQGPLTVQIARSLHEFDHECRELLVNFLVLGPLTLAVALGGGYFLARRALAPVEQITRAANQISADRLNERIAVPNPGDELGALAETLNRMIERLERSFTEMRRFTADAAHELRTPLAVMRSEAEVLLRCSRSPDDYARGVENLLEEANRLSQMTEQLLFLSRQDAGLHLAAREEVDPAGLVSDVVGTMQAVAQDRAIDLRLTGNAPCQLVGDARLLRRVLYNLLDNAFKYTQTTGTVSVCGAVEEGAWLLTVADTGVGIPPDHLPHVFDRFYRVDAARTDEGGAGLGLAICRSIVHCLGGTITIDSEVGRGTTVRVRLPCGKTTEQRAR
jgi:heavy metal sensor kinase